MRISDGTAINFFSAYSQAVAALVGLSATFGIFHYQNLKSNFTRRVEKIYGVFNSHFRVFMNEQQQIKFDDFVNHEQRASFIEPIYFNWITTDLNRQISKTLDDNRSRIHEFEMLSDEFNDYQQSKNKMKSFRSSFLVATMLGLFSIVLGLIGIVSVDVEIWKDERLFLLVVGMTVLIIYLIALYRLLDRSFQKPE
ncbi:MAG: hypothetical protein H7328_00745 [Bdellovibrio sp.]|nr:hypothetical protein [Bdellovibrio sp.]